uniref:Uncharacterized protein n=1 Tax=Magallana gigas TaxID=29159 RepID=K1QEB7_MAGGI
MDSSYDSGSSSDSPLSSRTRKRRSSTNDENDTSIKYVRCGDHVSKWDNSLLESYGILYDVKATELSGLFNSAFRDLYSVAVKGLKEAAVQLRNSTLGGILFPIRGDATGKMQLDLYGEETSSVPDLRFSMQRKCSAEERGVSVITATIGEVKMWSLAKEENTEFEFDIRNLKLKGQSVDSLMEQHGGELLVESTKSALQSTNLGIICIKTLIIFTCLDMDTEHLSSLQEGSPVHNEKSYIHYSQPYNILMAEWLVRSTWPFTARRIGSRGHEFKP